MNTRPRNWVFLGDSITEGVGALRVSYVTELARLLRDVESRKMESDRQAIHEIRLRRVDPATFNRFIEVNTAGCWRGDVAAPSGAIWLWNLACEGTTVKNDVEWLPWLDNLRPERVFIHRGSLESVIRPFTLRNDTWPWWVPPSWRGYAAMDPRCYFSSTPWRRLKQIAVDRLKQRVRLALLDEGESGPLMGVEEIREHLSTLVAQISGMARQVYIVGLFGIGDDTFPGSARQFKAVNAMLMSLAAECGAHFLAPPISGQRLDDPALYYLDRFHPNLNGARRVADFIANTTSR